jgi:hypothetical protein
MDLKNCEKARSKKIYWYWLLVFCATVLVVSTMLLLHKPAGFYRQGFVHDGQVSPYLTHELLPQLYNRAQRQEPFDLVVTQAGINDIIARSNWPKNYGGMQFSTPAVFFVPEGIVLMGAVVVGGLELVVTVAGEPALDQQGLLNLRVSQVKAGAVDITFFARELAERIYRQHADAKKANRETIGTKIARSLLNDEPFEPVFKIEDKKVRVEKITIGQKKLTIRLVPVFD